MTPYGRREGWRTTPRAGPRPPRPARRWVGMARRSAGTGARTRTGTPPGARPAAPCRSGAAPTRPPWRRSGVTAVTTDAPSPTGWSTRRATTPWTASTPGWVGPDRQKVTPRRAARRLRGRRRFLAPRHPLVLIPQCRQPRPQIGPSLLGAGQPMLDAAPLRPVHGTHAVHRHPAVGQLDPPMPRRHQMCRHPHPGLQENPVVLERGHPILWQPAMRTPELPAADPRDPPARTPHTASLRSTAPQHTYDLGRDTCAQ